MTEAVTVSDWPAEPRRLMTGWRGLTKGQREMLAPLNATQTAESRLPCRVFGATGRSQHLRRADGASISDLRCYPRSWSSRSATLFQ